MGGEVTVYSGDELELDEEGRLNISLKLRFGISIPFIGGIDIPPIFVDIILDVEEEEELENEEDDDDFMVEDFMFMLDIILPIISSMFDMPIGILLGGIVPRGVLLGGF